MKIEEIFDPTKEQLEAVNYELRTFNQTTNPVYWEKISKKENEPYSLNIFSYDENENITGGLFGVIQFKWLKVEIMAVKKELRGTGIGSTLLKHAEEIAKKKDCQYVYVDTMEFQGVDFYKNQDYEVVGTIKDWDSHGHSKFFMVKKINKI